MEKGKLPQTSQDYAELYHLLVRGMEIIGAFMNSTKEARKSFAGKQLERSYVLIRRDFLELRSSHPELGDMKHSVFSIISGLGGAYTAEFITEWAEGSMEPDEFGNLPQYPYGGNHMYEDELASIAEKAYLAGIEDIDAEAKRIKHQSTYNLAYEAIKAIKAMSINEYTLTWDEDSGEILVNGVWRLKTTYTESGSQTVELMKQIKAELDNTKSTEVEFDFEPNGTRTAAQTIIDLGITPTLKKIFFRTM